MARKARSSLFGVGAVAGILLIGLIYYTVDRPSTGADGSSEQEAVGQVGDLRSAEDPAEPSKAELKQAMAQLRERARVLAAERERPTRELPADSLGFPPETIAHAQEIFDEMWAVRGLVHTQEQRTDASRRLLESPRALELVYHTATDPEFARKAFGEQQAEARYYSITVLEEAAKQGPEKQELLKNAVSVVHRGLVTSDTFDRGRGEDFRGLLTAYTGVVDANEINEGTLRTLGYDENLPKEMKQIYYETVFSVLWKREGIEVAEARFKEIFAEG